MSHRTNQRPAPCATCKTPVAAGAGTLLGPPWKVVCQACLPFPSLAATPIRLSMSGRDKVLVEALGRIGNDRWGAYKGILDRHGVRARKLAAGWQNHADLSVAAELIQALSAEGFALEVDTGVRDAIAASGKAAEVDVSAATVRMDEVDAELARRGKSLYPFQRDGVGWLSARTGALLGDDMGLGKSAQSLISLPRHAPVLVIAPAVAKGVWSRETGNWRPDLRITRVDGRRRFRWPAPGEMVIVNFDILPPTEVKTHRAAQAADECASCGQAKCLHTALGRAHACLAFQAKEEDTYTTAPAPFLAECPDGLVVIVDEAHNCKNPKAQRTQRTRDIAATARGKGGRTWLLTATPLLNAPPELWSVFSVAGLQSVFGSWFSFARQMGGRQEEIKARGGRRVKVWVWDGMPTPTAAAQVKRVMLRRMKDDVLAELPAKTYKTIDVELDDPELQQDLDEAWTTLESELEGVIERDESPSIPFTEISELRARLAKAKIPAMLELVEEYEDAGEPVVVFSAHRAPIEELAARPGWAVIMGGTSPEERTRIEAAFQAGKLKGVGCTIKAGGVAITLTRAAHEIFVDREWTPALNAQAEDRCRRIGQERPVLINELVAEHALDRQVAELLKAKQAVIGAAVDRGRVAQGETVQNAAQVAQQALLALDGQAEKIEQARLAAAERDATLAALLARLEADEAAAVAREAKERTLSREERFERTVARAAAKQRELDGEAPLRTARTLVESWAERGIQALASMDEDMASELNGVGFSKDCVGIGHAIARELQTRYGLTDRGWEVCVGLCIRFKGQIGAPPAREEQAA